MHRSTMSARRAAPLALAAALTLGAGALSACGDSGGDSTAATTGAATPAAVPVVPRTPTLPPGTATDASTATSATGATTPSQSGAARAAGARPFSAQSPWNTRADALPVQSGSAALIRTATQRLGVKEGRAQDTVQTELRRINEPLYINTKVWTDPVVDTQDDGVPTKVVCRQINLPPPDNDCGDGWSVKTLDIPADERPRPQYDGWFTVVDRSTATAYDLWRARRSADGRSMSYQFMRKWDLNGPGFLAPTVVAARGSGLPLFAGLITPTDIRSGQIRHALAISVPGPASQTYVQPASVTDGNGPADSLPEGARIRLKAGVSITRLLSADPGRATGVPTGGDRLSTVRRKRFAGNTNRRAARAILTALRDYGAIVVDRAGTPTLYAQLTTDWAAPLRRADGALLQADGRTPVTRRERARPGAGTPLLRGNEVQGLLLTDFEVVALPPLRHDPALTGAADSLPPRLRGVSPQPTTTTSGATP
jgi:hypothetical protein